MSIKLDFSHFKHVKSDDKTTTLEHKKDKHQIILHHNTLSKPNVEQLKALGNSAKDAAQSDDKGEAKADSQAQDAKYGKVMDPKGNKPQVYAKGGEVTDSGDQANSDSVQPSDTQLELGNYQQPNVQDAMQFDPSKETHVTPAMEAAGNAGQAAKDDAAWAEGLSGAVGTRVGTNHLMTEEHNKALDEQAQQQMSAEPAQASVPAAQAPQSSPQPMGNSLSDPSKGIASGFDTQMSGIKKQATAMGDQGKEEADIYQNQADDQEQMLTTYQDQLGKVENDMKAHEADIRNGYIDPNKYWTGYTAANGDKIPGHSKMAAAIGMIISGFNPAGGPNGAESLLKYQMDQSMEGMKQNLNSSQNLLKANLEHYKDIQTATQVTRAMMNDAVIAQLQQAASKAKTPMAQAQALQAIGPLQREKAMATAQASAYQTLSHLSQGGIDANGKQDPMNTGAAEQAALEMQRFNPELAKNVQQRIVPGVGVASQPVADDIRNEMVGKKNFSNMAQHYVDWVKQNSGTFNPAKIAQGAAMAAELQGAYRQASKGGTYKEGEQEFIEKLIPSKPDQFAGSIRTLPKVQELINSNNSQLETLRRGYGMPPSQLGQQTQQNPRIDKQKAINWGASPRNRYSTNRILT